MSLDFTSLVQKVDILLGSSLVRIDTEGIGLKFDGDTLVIGGDNNPQYLLHELGHLAFTKHERLKTKNPVWYKVRDGSWADVDHEFHVYACQRRLAEQFDIKFDHLLLNRLLRYRGWPAYLLAHPEYAKNFGNDRWANTLLVNEIMEADYYNRLPLDECIARIRQAVSIVETMASKASCCPLEES